MVVCLELPAHDLEHHLQRAAHRRHQARRSTIRRAAGRLGLIDSRHSGDSVLRAVPEHGADLHDRRLSAARVAAEHRDRLRHQRHADRRFAHLAEGPAQPEDGRGSAVGTPQRRAAAVADRLVQLHGALHGPPRHGEHRHAVRQLSARPGRSGSRSTCSRKRSGTARVFRSTSSRTTGGCRIGSPSTPACVTR